jgi:hypothetical protein
MWGIWATCDRAENREKGKRKYNKSPETKKSKKKITTKPSLPQCPHRALGSGDDRLLQPLPNVVFMIPDPFPVLRQFGGG